LDDQKIPLKPMRRILVSDEIIEQIKNLILDGTLKAGDPLGSETKLASQMNVGRSTIREALKVLIHMGFIERKQKVAVVSDSIRSDINPREMIDRFKKSRNLLEMVEVRKIIEPDISAMAASRRGSDDLKLIELDVEAMGRTSDLDAFLNHDYHFHLHIAQASGNKILIEIIRGIQDLLKKTQEHILRQSESIHPRSLEYHRKIFEAIRKEQPEEASKQMADHISDIENELYKIMQKDNVN
jgi:GntR family transcriptional repressor for pyruvate dehydrogenase complex